MVRGRGIRNQATALFTFLLALLTPVVSPAFAADPIRVGFSMALTGGVAPNGKMIMAALELWRDDVNEKGGLLGRPVELVYYDDQSSPANVPGIYTKLLTRRQSRSAARSLRDQHGGTGNAGDHPAQQAHHQLHRHRHQPPFQLSEIFLDGAGRAGRGELVLARLLRAGGGSRRRGRRRLRSSRPMPSLRAAPRTARATRRRSRVSASSTTRAIRPDHRFRAGGAGGPGRQCRTSSIIAAYPPDTVGIVRAANEANLTPKMFGGAMIGFLVTPIKVQLGALANGIVIGESFVPRADVQLSRPRRAAASATRRRRRASASIRSATPSCRSGMRPDRCSPRRSTETKSLDHDKLADYLRGKRFSTVAGELAFGKDGEWAKSRQLWTQFQNVAPERSRAVPPGPQPADPVAGRVQERHHDLPLREARNEVAASLQPCAGGHQ